MDGPIALAHWSCRVNLLPAPRLWRRPGMNWRQTSKARPSLGRAWS
jgi:hypothetical protein